MPESKIDFNTLARFGLNQFTISVNRSKSAGYKIETQPVENIDICDAMTELLPGSLEQDSASATMMQDGATVITGFHKAAHPRLSSLLREGRDAYFTKVLGPMYDDTARINIARDVARAIIRDAIEPSELRFEMTCGCLTGSQAADLVNRLRAMIGDIAKGKQVLVPGSCHHLNSDFRQLFDQQVEQRFRFMLKEAIVRVTPEIAEEMQRLKKGLSLANEYLASS